MKVLIHSDEYYPTAQACAYRMSVLAHAFMDAGHEVTVLTSSVNKRNAIFEAQQENIIYAPAIPMKKKTALYRLCNNLSFAVTSLLMGIKSGPADVVITTSPPPLISISGWMIARLKRALLIYDVRDIWPDVAVEMESIREGSLFYKVFKWIVTFMYRHSNLITTVSPGKVRKIENYVKECSRNRRRKVLLVSNGFDERVLDNTEDTDLISKYHLNEKYSCVYIGNIGHAQGLEVLLDLAERMKENDNVQFLLFGSGAEKEDLEQKAASRNLDQVHFCGVLAHDKVYTILRHAGLSFIPLKNSNMKDSIPTKVYEALGIGCPVLLLAEGDSCDIVEESGLGLHISPDHPDQLYAAFTEIMNNKEHYESIKDSSIALMKTKYSRQKIAAEFVQKISVKYQKKKRPERRH